MIIKNFNRSEYLQTLTNLKKIKTICLEANCPNRYECFSNKTATLLLMGDVCTRNCHYCNVKTGVPKPINLLEIINVVEAVKILDLKYVVLTQVTRDDLFDGGASYIVEVIKMLRKQSPKLKIEILISDLNGNWQALKKIVNIKPDVINHNIEVVKDYFLKLRPEGDYERSLLLLDKVKKQDSKIKLKSGLMVGFGETQDQIIKTLEDLKKVGVEMVTIGQYYAPDVSKAIVLKKYSKTEFAELQKIALKIGFSKVVAGSLVRSSYHAEELLNGS